MARFDLKQKNSKGTLDDRGGGKEERGGRAGTRKETPPMGSGGGKTTFVTVSNGKAYLPPHPSETQGGCSRAHLISVSRQGGKDSRDRPCNKSRKQNNNEGKQRRDVLWSINGSLPVYDNKIREEGNRFRGLEKEKGGRETASYGLNVGVIVAGSCGDD